MNNQLSSTERNHFFRIIKYYVSSLFIKFSPMTSSRLFFLKGGLPSTLDCLAIKLKYIKQSEVKQNENRTTKAQFSARIKLSFQAEITANRISPLHNHARQKFKTLLAMEDSNFRSVYFL